MDKMMNSALYPNGFAHSPRNWPKYPTHVNSR